MFHGLFFVLFFQFLFCYHKYHLTFPSPFNHIQILLQCCELHATITTIQFSYSWCMKISLPKVIANVADNSLQNVRDFRKHDRKIVRKKTLNSRYFIYEIKWSFMALQGQSYYSNSGPLTPNPDLFITENIIKQIKKNISLHICLNKCSLLPSPGFHFWSQSNILWKLFCFIRYYVFFLSTCTSW